MDTSAPELLRPLPDLVGLAVQQALEQYGFQKAAASYVSRPIVGTFDDFCEYLAAERDRKSSTVGDYRRDVNLFAIYVEKTFGRPAETTDLTVDNFRAFVAAQRRAEHAGSSVARRAHGLRAYWTFLFKRKLAQAPPTLEDMDLRFKRCQTHHRVLTTKEFVQLCKSPESPSRLS